MRALSNIFWLGLKELRSFLNDYVLLGTTEKISELWQMILVLI